MRLRVGLTLGDVEDVGKQQLSDAFTEATRIIDHERVRELLNETRPMVLATSKLFWDDWNNHADKATPGLAVSPLLPWSRVELEVKHGVRLIAHIQREDVSSGQTGVDLTIWLQALLHRTGSLEIRGIGSGAGRQKDAGRYPIEQLYTTLRSSGGGNQDLKELLHGSFRLL
ncbi:MAG: hypothetical protein HQL56_18925, partial [Magnetococcales bacterium]|nr:hypothetical protein [Magnetococcales bacterium]